MKLHRLTPTSLAQAAGRYSGRCAACDQPVDYSEPVVHLYGEKFHRDCAFYRSGDSARRRTAA